MNELLLKKTPFRLTLLIIVVVAVWFRANHLTAQPFWLDEGYSAYAADKGFAFIFHVVPGYETHPPFYSAVLRTWTLLVGNSLFGFRSLGLFVGLVALPLYWVVGAEIGRAFGTNPRLTALATLALAAVLPAIVDVTRLVRPYALIAPVYALGIWAVFRLARAHRETDRLPLKAWSLYLLCLALLFWLHNLGALYVASLGLGLLILIGPVVLIRDHPKPFFIGHALVALVALPALLILLDQAPTWTHSTWLAFHPETVGSTLMLIYGLAGIGGLIFAVVTIAGLATGDRAARVRPFIALATLAILPVALSIMLSIMIAPVFLPRTLLAASTALILLIAAGAAAQSLIPRVAFLILLALTTVQLVRIQTLKSPEDWYSAVAWLKARVGPNDVIYAYPNEGALPLGYALRDKRLPYPIRAIPSDVPSHDPTGWYPTGSRGVVSLPQYRLEEIASDAQSRAVPTIWLLRLGPAAYDKGDGFVKALSRTRTVVGRWHREPIDLTGLRLSPQIAPREQAQP